MNSPATIRHWHGQITRLIAWFVVPLFVIGVAGNLWLQRRLGVPTTLFYLMLVAGFGAYSIVGTVLLARRPENLVSWIMVAIGLIGALFPAAEMYAAWIMSTRGVPDTLAVFGAWANDIYFYVLLALIFVFLPLYFPHGRLPSPRWRWAVLIVIGAIALALVPSMFRVTMTGQNIPYEMVNPIGIPGVPDVEENALLFGMLVGGLTIGLITAAAAVIVRYRQSQGVQRQQLKWFLYSVAFYPLLLLGDSLPEVMSDILLGLEVILLPIAVCVAVLRYRLYDIDVIIRRTTSYAILTGLLLLVYFGTIVVLQRLLSPITGDSQAAVVLSTLLIAALFLPLRRRVQDAIDRRFFRRKYDAEQVLEQFAATVRDETDLDALTAELVRVIQETMQPEFVSVWLKPDSLEAPEAAGSG
jgi:hypothetical protein